MFKLVLCTRITNGINGLHQVPKILLNSFQIQNQELNFVFHLKSVQI
jgi:hypothetical protein